MFNDTLIEAVVDEYVQQKIMPCLEYPHTHPLWWARMEALLRSRQGDGPEIYSSLLKIAAMAQSSWASDEDVIDCLVALLRPTGQTDEVVTQSVVKCIVALVFGDMLRTVE